MQVFELHFNPKTKKDYYFDTFIYHPEKSSEKRLGSLYALGEIKSSLPQDERLLNKLAETIKKNFYSSLTKKTEESLTESLKAANSFLSEEVQNNNVHWLGKLGFAAVSIKDFDLSFTKTGGVKLMLIRGGSIINIGENLEKQEISPYPLKVFFNVVSGKLAEGDLVLLTTEDSYKFLLKQGAISQLARKGAEIEEEEIRKILPPSIFRKGEGAETAGALVLLSLKKDKKAAATTLLFKNQEKFSWKEVFQPLTAPFHKVKKKSLKKKKKRGLPSFSFPFSKRIVLVLLLFAILLLGFLIFKQKQESKNLKAEEKISSIEEKIASAENYSIIQKQKEANNLLKEAWKETKSLPEEIAEKEKTKSLMRTIEEKLFQLNNLEAIENPKSVAEVEFEATDILAVDSSLYLQGKERNGIYQISPTEQFIPSNQALDLAASYQNSAFFYSPPKNIVSFKDKEWSSASIEPWNEEEFIEMTCYWSSLYFLTKDCQVIKYPSVKDLEWGAPQEWLQSSLPCSNPKSFSIDGSVWIIDKENNIWELYQGEIKEKTALDTFPFVKSLEKVFTSNALPYLYVLEPEQKRVLVVDKETKEVFRQFQSPRFSNLKDMNVSADENTIWILNGKFVYQLEM